jgi:hypothetical protein
MNAAGRRCDQCGMTVNDLEQRLSDLERRHDRTRTLLVDALSAAILLLIGFTFRPEGWSAAMLGFCGGFFASPSSRPCFCAIGPRNRPSCAGAHRRRLRPGAISIAIRSATDARNGEGRYVPPLWRRDQQLPDILQCGPPRARMRLP